MREGGGHVDMMHGIELDIASWRSVHGGWLVLSCTQINERRQLGSVLQALPFFFPLPRSLPPPYNPHGGRCSRDIFSENKIFFQNEIKDYRCQREEKPVRNQPLASLVLDSVCVSSRLDDESTVK